MIRRRHVDRLFANRLRWATRIGCLLVCSSFLTSVSPGDAQAQVRIGSPKRELEDREFQRVDSADSQEDRDSASQSVSGRSLADSLNDALPEDVKRWIEPERFAYSVQLVMAMTLLGLIPAVMLMTTSYIRISIVLSLLRQAFGAQLLPAQVTTALAMFCTGLVMWPTWTIVHQQAVVPLVQGDQPIDVVRVWDRGIQPIRDFMVRQIDANNNAEDVHLFARHLNGSDSYPTSYDQVPLRALMPAFVLSELKTAFLIGFRIYLPFLVIDLLVAAVTTSMGMFMLPPAMVSLPMKLLLFVIADGWHLIVEMLLSSFH